MFRIASCLVLCVALAAVPARAHAETPQHHAAKALMHQGDGQYFEGDYAGALQSFRAAYALLPNPKLWFNIGQAALKVGNAVAAANAYDDFLEHTLESADLVATRKLARAHLRELENELARGHFHVEPAQAELTIDGKPLLERATYAAPGPHEVGASAKGYQPLSKHLVVRAAELRTVSMALRPMPVAAPKPEVELTPHPKTPTRPLVTRPLKAPPATAHRSRTWGWVLMGAGGVALAGSAVAGGFASSRNAMLTKVVDGDPLDGVGTGPGLTSPGEAAKVLRTSVSRDATLSTVALGVGAVAVGVALFLLLRGDSPTSTPAGAPALSF